MIINKVMSFVCSNSYKNYITRQTNHLFQCISGSKAMLWNFQSVKCSNAWTNMWNKMMEEKPTVERQYWKAES